MSTPLPTVAAALPGIDLPIGVPDEHMSKLPTSFRVNTEIKAFLSQLSKGPRSRGFHPSELARLCGMKFHIYDQAIEGFASTDPEVIVRSLDVVRRVLDTEHDVAPGRAPTHLMADFHAGDQIHLYQQFRYGERGYLWGRWECPACESVTDAPGLMPRVMVPDRNGSPIKVAARCPACRGKNYLRKYGQVRWRYVEPWMGLPEWELDGHCDGIVLFPRKDYVVPALMEIKSINEGGYFGRYGEPLPREDHIKQASQYVFSAQQTYPFLRDVKHIYFVYVNKNAQRDTKEFLVPADMGVVRDMQVTMSALLTAKRTAQRPEHTRKCQSVCAQDAIKCPVIEECFGEKPPVNFFSESFNAEEELPL